MIDKCELTGSGIILRRYCPDDAEGVYLAVRESIAELSPRVQWCHEKYALDETKTWIASCAETWAKGEAYDFLIVDRINNSPLGGCGLNQLNKLDRIANLGYWVRTSRAGQGIATEAARLLADFGFKYLKLNRIEMIIAVDNAASQRVAQKLGAMREGVLRNRIAVRDRIYDALMFSLIPGNLEVLNTHN